MNLRSDPACDVPRLRLKVALSLFCMKESTEHATLALAAAQLCAALKAATRLNPSCLMALPSETKFGPGRCTEGFAGLPFTAMASEESLSATPIATSLVGAVFGLKPSCRSFFEDEEPKV
eukprot:2663709-Pleurochrysis_carterae.AAC.1